MDQQLNRNREQTEIITGVIVGIGLLFVMMFFIGLLLLSFVLICIGSRHHCNEQKLKTWMFVYGITLLVNTIGTYLSITATQSHGYWNLFLGICYAFLFVWLSIGAVWYYNFDVGYNYINCDDFLYKLGVGTINGSYSIMGVFIVLQCVSYMSR